MIVYLRTKFQVSSITLTSFRQREPLKSPPRLGLAHNFDVNYIFNAKKTLVDEPDTTHPKYAPENKVGSNI